MEPITAENRLFASKLRQIALAAFAKESPNIALLDCRTESLQSRNEYYIPAFNKRTCRYLFIWLPTSITQDEARYEIDRMLVEWRQSEYAENCSNAMKRYQTAEL